MDTIWGCCIMFSIFSLVVGTFWLLSGIFGSRKLKDKMFLAPLNGLVAGTVAAVFLLYTNGYIHSGSSILNVILMSAFDTIQVFLAEQDPASTREAVGIVQGSIGYAIQIYISFLHLLAPALLAGFALSFVQGFFPRLKYMFLGKGHLYAFSELCERSLLLAEDIRRKEPEALLVFAGEGFLEDERVYELNIRAEKLDAYCFKDEITDLVIPKGCKSSSMDFFLLEENEDNNLKRTMELVEKYRDVLPACIHVAATQPEAEALLDSIDKGKYKPVSLRLINEKRAIVYNLLDRMPLFLGVEQDGLDILITGSGRTGMEVLKAVCWCGQVGSIRPEIHVLYSGWDMEDCFRRQCPELTLGGSSERGKPDCTVHFHKVNLQGAGLSDFIGNHPEIGYVICAMEDETLNMRTAIDIRSLCEGLNPSFSSGRRRLPIINVLINNPFLYKVGRELRYGNAAEYHLNTFGSLAEFYTMEMISGSYMDRLAFGVHTYYSKSDEKYEDYGQARLSFENSEYSRHSSMVAALHLKYKLFSCPALTDIAEYVWCGHPSKDMIETYRRYIAALDASPEYRDTVSCERVEQLAKIEHRRWNAFMRSEGWQKAERQDVAKWYKSLGNHKNMLAKRHPTIADWEELDEISLWMKEDWGKVSDFKQIDKDIIIALPDIMVPVCMALRTD